MDLVEGKQDANVTDMACAGSDSQPLWGRRLTPTTLQKLKLWSQPRVLHSGNRFALTFQKLTIFTVTPGCLSPMLSGTPTAFNRFSSTPMEARASLIFSALFVASS